MKKLAHSNLVRLYEVIDSPADDKLFLVLELIRGGQIMYWDDKQFRYVAPNMPIGVLDKDAVRECLRDVVAALDFLHRNHICHRDIKPENILLAGDRYKLADFGVAYMNEDSPPTAAKSGDAAALKLRSTEGTYHFLAPECTTGDEYDPYQVDVWALGVTMFTLLLGTLPFGTSVASLSDVMTSIREDQLIIPQGLDPDCAELLTQLMEKNPGLRITIPQLKTHPWLFGSGGEFDRRQSGLEVMVTQQEIEAAFTPVNNFILVMKLKMKMSSRLNNVRKSLANSPNGRRRAEAVPVTKHFPISSYLSTDKSEEGNDHTVSKTIEMAPSEQPRAMADRMQRRSSRLVESISETMGSLTTTLGRRKSQIGAISPMFDSTATPASSPVPAEDSPGKASPSDRPGVSLRALTRRNSRSVRSLIPDIYQRTDSASVENSPSTGEERKQLAHRLTKRKSTSLRGFARATGISEDENTSESASPTDRSNRRESLPAKRGYSSELPVPNTPASGSPFAKDTVPSSTEADTSPLRRLARKNSMSFRALVVPPDLQTSSNWSENEESAESIVQSRVASNSTADFSQPNALSTANTRPVILSRRLSMRTSRTIRSLNIAGGTPTADVQKHSPPMNATPQIHPCPMKEDLESAGSVSSVPAGDGSSAKSGSTSPIREMSVHLSRRHSMSFRAFIPMSDGPVDAEDIRERETLPMSDTGNTSPTGVYGTESTLTEESSPNKSASSSPTSKLARRLSRRASSSFRALPLTIDIPKREEGVKENETSPTKASLRKLSPTGTAIDTTISTAQTSSPSSSSETATSPRLSTPNSPLGTPTTKPKVLGDEHLLQPMHKAKLPVLELHLSPISSPAISPVASPRRVANSSDGETQGDSTPRRRSSSPSKAIEPRGAPTPRISPLHQERSSSLKLDGFSSSSAEAENPSDSLPISVVKSCPLASDPIVETSRTQETLPAPAQTPRDSDSPHTRKRTPATSRPTSLRPDPDKRPQSLSESTTSAGSDDDPSSALERKSSLAKVLDECLTTGRAHDRSVGAVAPAPDATKTSVNSRTPTSRHHVQAPPLIRPEVESPSHGRHHQIAPLDPIERPSRMESSPGLIVGESPSPSPPRRRSIAQAHDSLRNLFHGQSSVRLSMLDENRGANIVTPDKARTIKSKVCGIMPSRSKKRKQADTGAPAADASEPKAVKSRADGGPTPHEPEPEFKHAVVDPATLADNPLFTEDETPLSGLVPGLSVDSLPVQPAPMADGLLPMKDEPMTDDVMDALLSLLNSSLSTDGREAAAAAPGVVPKSTSSTDSHDIFAEGRPPVVLPPQPAGVVENGQFSDDTLNGLMRWAAANSASAS
ncbi:unnamed protein product [Phytophthora fragariaefolia]|uniref:Unnamed protein product n=1 Tax=Phytophthora fragariaefolia TaxID=1490495 RepID=A0A9W7CSZ3_9STRA|nr:unnamed protein product [Phytophthora fragariaefolia]